MKHEDLRKLKPGDKVIVEVSHVNDTNGEVDVAIDTDYLNSEYINLDKIYGVYHEPSKIEFTEAEKKEFDWLHERYSTLLQAVIYVDCNLPNLYSLLFGGKSKSDNNLGQLKFARAWANPELIEVKRSKKYYAHLFPGECGYLNYSEDDDRYSLRDNGQGPGYQTKFTMNEIEKINKLGAFKIKPEALEEAKGDE